MLDVDQMNQFADAQIDCLNMMTELIAYDKAEAEKNNQQPMNTKLVEAFIDTQRKALNTFLELIAKHKPALDAVNAKLAEERAEKAKAESAKKKLIDDVKKAVKDTNSLFCEACEPEDDEPTELALDEYSFEEND